jgi:hypothetical protein
MAGPGTTLIVPLQLTYLPAPSVLHGMPPEISQVSLTQYPTQYPTQPALTPMMDGRRMWGGGRRLRI